MFIYMSLNAYILAYIRHVPTISTNGGKPYGRRSTNNPITVRNEPFDTPLMYFPGVGYDAGKPILNGLNR